ncbi:MAG: glutamate--tRNA ligase [Gammaproteobacteria bacterium]|nr:glutamate--tRNA ligase [Gammaproteobacteria bacterium]MCW5583760.1 glutamate--tRNA ligase [Gammaproteobacteria bacterium]
MTIRTRFSPSPTGMIHLGNARAALFSALFAAKHQGVFILRIEDTDASRSDIRFVESLQEDLHWLGVYWQEGPGVSGVYGPYWQSQRQDIYASYYKILEEKKFIYPCFCTDQELMLARKIQLSRGQAPRYAGTCSKLSAVEISQRLKEGKKPAWRFSIPAHQSIEFVDIVKGQQHFKSDDIGDFIVRRADGTAPFLFCNAIDDAVMKVSHVLRGEDHLANTPRQIMLLRALDLHVPHYGHLSLIVGDDGSPLSKRHGSFSIHEMREKGYLPIAIMNYLARLGHICDSQALLNFDGLAPHFHLEKLSRSPARFDLSQLMFWQKIAIQALDVPGLWRWLGENIQNQVPENLRDTFAETIKTNIEFPYDAAMWAKIFFHENVHIDEPELTILRNAGEQFFVEAEQAIDKHGVDFVNVLTEMKQTLGVQGKKLYMPLRIALTGKMHGPELAHIAELLGKKKIKHRLSQAFKLSNDKVAGVE